MFILVLENPQIRDVAWQSSMDLSKWVLQDKHVVETADVYSLLEEVGWEKKATLKNNNAQDNT